MLFDIASYFLKFYKHLFIILFNKIYYTRISSKHNIYPQ